MASTFSCNYPMNIMPLPAISFVLFYRVIVADAMYTYFCDEPELFRFCPGAALFEKFGEKEFFAAGSEALQVASRPGKSL
ncbi:hypothetical protein QUF75_18095 [Desulfococcaceae bacterium HSG7]|nr:hypothetical protein [Desulfococcaceae bacterium HSG7]